MDVSPNQNNSDLFGVMSHHQEVHFGIRSSPFCEDYSRSAKVLDTVCAAWSLVALVYAIPTSSKSHLHNNRSPLSLMSSYSWLASWRLYHVFLACGFAVGVFGHGIGDHRWSSLGICFGFLAAVLICSGSHPIMTSILFFPFLSLLFWMKGDEMLYLTLWYSTTCISLYCMGKIRSALWIILTWVFLIIDAKVCKDVPLGTHWLSHATLNMAMPNIVTFLDNIHDKISNKVCVLKTK